RISRSALNGFSMKSYAPRRIAETAVSMLPWPEIITTGRLGCMVLISSSRARPSRRDPCSQMSRKTSRGTRSAMAASALSASCAVRVSCPSSLRMPATSSRISSSSSTIRMSDAITYLLDFTVICHRGPRLIGTAPVGRRQDHCDHGPASAMKIRRSVMELQPTSVVLDDLLDDSEAKASAFFPSRHIGLEQALPVFARQALAIVHHVDADHPAG